MCVLGREGNIFRFKWMEKKFEVCYPSKTMVLDTQKWSYFVCRFRVNSAKIRKGWFINDVLYYMGVSWWSKRIIINGSLTAQNRVTAFLEKSEKSWWNCAVCFFFLKLILDSYIENLMHKCKEENLRKLTKVFSR